MKYGNDNDGRAHVRTPDGQRVYVAQLSAIAAGYAPKDVFSDEKEVHHVDENPWNDSRTNVALLNRENHRGIHALKNAIRKREAQA